MSDFKENVFKKMDLEKATKILDIGCGHGQQLQKISKIVDHEIELTGIDKMEKSLATAKQNCINNDNLNFINHDIAEGIPFADNYFDIVFSINVLECIADKDKLLQEISRVLKPAEQIVMAHYDFDTQLFDGTDKNLVRKIVTTYSDWEQDWMDDSDPWMGRRLWRVINGSRLFTGGIDAYVLTETEYAPGKYGYNMAESFASMVDRGLITEKEYNNFIQDLEDLARSDQYFYSLNMYVYTGMRRDGNNND